MVTEVTAQSLRIPVSLLDLAKQTFAPRSLTAAEEELFNDTEKGQVASMLSGSEIQDDPANAADWTDERVVHAESLIWLCTNRQASALVSHRGIEMHGVRVDGDVDLNDTDIAFSLCMWKCALNGDFRLHRAHIKGLYLLGSCVKTLNATEASIDAGVFL